ncbi:hypothetical protein [Dinghuibacter silviterrae]|nr:hypothetical protein [Dinghuibacter silviterrae]
MKVVERLLNSHEGWQGVVALTREEGLKKLNGDLYDAVLLCVGVTETDEVEFRKAATNQTKVIRHYGGGSGLLENEIRSAVSDTRL